MAPMSAPPPHSLPAEQRGFLRGNQTPNGSPQWKNGSEASATRVPHSIEPAKRMPTSKPKRVVWWRLEILWAVIMVASLLALTIGLRELDGRDVPDWGFLTLNTVVAILTTVMSSSMTAIISSSISQSLWNWMAESRSGDRVKFRRHLDDLSLFDNASRGPMGGLRLIWRLHGRSLTTLGALLIVLNLGLGALTQQLVSTNNVRLMPDGPSPGLPRSERFKSVPFRGQPRLSNPEDPDVYTKAAIYNAAVGGNITDLSPSCPSGNCTYPLTPTLGLCGTCTDISSKLNNTGTCNLNDTGICAYHLPNGASLTFNSEHAAVNSWAIFNITETGGLNSTSGGIMPTVYDDPNKMYALVFSTVGLPPKAAFQWFTPGSSEPMGTFPMPPMEAHECALWWCIQTYNISITSGIAAKTLVQTWSEAQQTTEGGLQENFTNIPAEMNTQNDIIYGVDSEDQSGVRTALGAITLNQGEGIVQYIDDDGLVSFGSSQAALPMYDLTADVFEGAWQGSSDFHNDDGTGWIDIMARSLSNNVAITNPANESSIHYRGVSNIPHSYVVVRWAYIAFPIALNLLCLLFFAWTVSETRRKSLRPWRVGMLPLLLMQADEDVQSQAIRERALDHPHGLDAIGKIELRLKRRDDGAWGFARPYHVGYA